jgi:hypothetical protein
MLGATVVTVPNQTRETKTMSDAGMPVPEWVSGAREEMQEVIGNGEPEAIGKLERRDLPVVEEFSTLFAEYEVKGKDLLVHLFPRGGEEDRYWPCEYREDGTYIPGRLEEVVESVRFSDVVVDLIKAAADKVWQGDVAIDRAKILRYGESADVENDDPVEVDMGAFAIQFQQAANTVKIVGVPKFVDDFCEALDDLLE